MITADPKQPVLRPPLFTQLHAPRVGILLALAICAYLPVLRLPFIQDDYVLIPLARMYAAQNWIPLWHDVDFRTRAVYMFLTAALDRTLGFAPQPFYAVNILLHALCVLLVYAAGVWIELGATTAFWAACFFAIHEGHQEAIMWVSSSSELLVFLFGMTAWICWVKWLRQGNWRWYPAALMVFVLALGSKESAWVFPALMLIPVLADRRNRPRALKGILPFFALAAMYVGSIWITRVAKPGYSDIRFSLSSPWPIVIVRSFWRLIFIWGLVAAAILLWIDGKQGRRTMWIASLWMVLGILPYSFLSYMLQIPSRATYIASAGLALLVGAAAAKLIEDRRRTLFVILSAVVLIVNLEILWVKKMAQFRERAEPSELLKQAAAQSSGPVTIECTPMAPIVTQLVLEQAGKQAVFSPQARQDDHCFIVQYTTAAGSLVRINQRVATQRHGMFY